MSGENCPIFCISWFSWVDMHSNIFKLWENREEFGMGSFACYHKQHCIAEMMYEPMQLYKNTLLQKRNATFGISWGVNFCYFTCTQNSEYCKRTMNNFGMGAFAQTIIFPDPGPRRQDLVEKLSDKYNFLAQFLTPPYFLGEEKNLPPPWASRPLGFGGGAQGGGGG